MNPWWRIFFWTILLALGLFTVELGLSFWPWSRSLFFLPLLVVLVLTAVQNLRWGIGAALVVGWIMSLLSLLPQVLIIVAFLFAVSLSWLISHRILSTRSLASFIATVASGTAIYYLTIIAGFAVLRLFQPNLATPTWQPWLIAAAIHCLVHPLLAALIWVSSGRTRQYATTQLQSHTSF